MEFNTCPHCKSRLKMKLLGYKAECKSCNKPSIESAITKGLQIATLLISFIALIMLQHQGTEKILASNPEDTFTALFTYYISLLFYMGIIVGVINYVIRNYFAIYEPPKGT